MNIHEVEVVVGLSKKSIRYYEENGLITPKRNKENDYRVYSDVDINKLKIIKFLRELNVPIRELKLLNDGLLTLQECMQDRIKKIEMEEENYQKIKNMCEEIEKSTDTFTSIDINNYFQEINILKKEGFTLKDVKISHVKKIRGAILSSLIFSAFFVFIILVISYFQFTENDNMPLVIYLFVMLIFLIPIISISYNLIVRIKEIKKGEEDEASKY